jgi:hypothetical protein
VPDCCVSDSVSKACSGPATIVNRSKMQSLRVVFYHASGSTSQDLSGTPANSTTSVWSWS